MEEKKFSDNFSENKVLSENGSNNFSPSVNVHLGLGTAVKAYFDYRKYKISITEKNIEPLYHLVRKHALTTQIKTKDFIDKVFKLYEKGYVEITLPVLRVIEYMDDELLGAIKYFADKIQDGSPRLRWIADKNIDQYTQEQSEFFIKEEVRKKYDLKTHNLILHSGGNIGNSDVVSNTMLEILALIQATQC